MITSKLASDTLNSNRNVARYNVRVPIGATGAVGTRIGKGIVLTRTDVGLYTATIQGLRGGVGAILGAHVHVISATRTLAYIATAVASTGVVTFATAAASAPNTVADPADGAHIVIEIVVRNSSSDRS